jgi:HTH-type transcriptional regulator/antitoxin HigA
MIDMRLEKPFKMDIKPIRDDADHAAAVRAIEALWGAQQGTPEYDHIDVLATLVEAYEAKRWPVADLDPVAMIEAAMAQDGHSQKELAALIGGNRASEVLARKRALNLPMIRKIAAAWKLPVSVLTGEYTLVK